MSKRDEDGRVLKEVRSSEIEIRSKEGVDLGVLIHGTRYIKGVQRKKMTRSDFLLAM